MLAWLLALAVATATDPSPDALALALARRVMTDQRAPTLRDALRHAPAPPGASPAWVAAANQAIDENGPLYDHIVGELEQIYVDMLSEAEMTAWAAYLESPVGRRIQVKKLQAAATATPPALTAEETAAQDAFNATPEAKSIAAKNGTLIGRSIPISMEWATAIFNRAQATYCASPRADCRDGKLVRDAVMPPK